MLRLLYRIMEWIDGERGISLISYRLASIVKWWCLSYMDLEEKAVPLSRSTIGWQISANMKTLYIILLTIFFTLSLMTSSLMTSTLLALPEGVMDIGRGGLEYIAQTARLDEAGKLSDSFNNTEDSVKNVVLPISNLKKEIVFSEKNKRLDKFSQTIENFISKNYKQLYFQKTTKDFISKNKNMLTTFFQKNTNNFYFQKITENFFSKNMQRIFFQKITENFFPKSHKQFLFSKITNNFLSQNIENSTFQKTKKIIDITKPPNPQNKI